MEIKTKFNIKDRVYCLSNEDGQWKIECIVISRISIVENTVVYDGYVTCESRLHYIEAKEEYVANTPQELLQYFKDNVERFVPVVWRR